jgi:AcrR family transcriptional regulator
MSNTAAAPNAAPQGLRERKKQRTRDALVDAANRLFLSQGYARTTVDEIAAAVDVSQRTFFRYFANKEEAALAVLADAERYFVARLRTRPAAESPLEAMHAAVCEAWRDLHAAHRRDGRGVTAALELAQLIESTPTLRAAYLCHQAEQEQQVVEVLAAREEVDPVTDLRPRLLAATFGALIRSAHQAWTIQGAQAQEDGPAGMVTMIGRHVDQLGPTLAGHWH